MSIRIAKFGGLSPSVDPRNLAPDGAQVAMDVDLRFGDFRPSRGLGPSVATVPSGTKSIFRTPSGTWLSSTTDTDYVNAQVNDAAQERVYLTGRSAYPEAWEGPGAGTYRRLGVPAPSDKPAAELQATDQFDSDDATTAQQEALEATAVAVLATGSASWLGNLPPASAPTAPGLTPDPDYDKVLMHLRFDAFPGSTFTDSSLRATPITTEAGVTFLNDNTGPLGTDGAGCGNFAGTTAGGLTFPWIEAHDAWTFEAFLKPTEDLEWVELQSRDGGLRKLTLRTPGGGYRTLLTNTYGNMGGSVLKVKRTNGDHAMLSGVPVHLAVVCDGASMAVYLDGVRCGSVGYGDSLEANVFGRASNSNTEALQAKVDEVRISSFARYSGATFTAPDEPFGVLPTVSGTLGIFIQHGDVLATGMPTDDDGDAVFAIELTASGGGFVAANSALDWMRTSGLPGAQITYDGDPYWAVLLKDWRAAGRNNTLAALDAALTAVVDPSDPPNPLLTAGQVDDLAAVAMTVYGPDGSIVLPMIAAVNSAQVALVSAFNSAGTTAATAAPKLAELKRASAVIEAHFGNLGAEVRAYLQENASDIFGGIKARVVQRVIESRAYVVTFVTDWDEESAPSRPSELVELDQNDAVLVTASAPPSGRNIIGWRLYRSSTTNSGAAFQLVADDSASNAVLKDGAFAYFSTSDLSYIDDMKQEELQEPCATLTWLEPPATLKGLVGLPNGIMAGFLGKTLCFCEPYAPYAWPIEYQQTLKYNIVALGVFGQTVVVLTEGHPYYASGADSASMSTQEVEVPQSCVAKRTVASVEGGVIFASPDGLCLATASGVQVLTHLAFSKDDWQALVDGNAFGAYNDGSYYLFTA
jgi:hypothetical protein